MRPCVCVCVSHQQINHRVDDVVWDTVKRQDSSSMQHSRLQSARSHRYLVVSLIVARKGQLRKPINGGFQVDKSWQRLRVWQKTCLVLYAMLLIVELVLPPHPRRDSDIRGHASALCLVIHDHWEPPSAHRRPFRADSLPTGRISSSPTSHSIARIAHSHSHPTHP